jgi:hypothetical protein
MHSKEERRDEAETDQGSIAETNAQYLDTTFIGHFHAKQIGDKTLKLSILTRPS